MIRAKKSAAFERVFDPYSGILVRRHFHRVLVRGDAGLDTVDRGRPVILYANHSSWWDAIMPYVLSRRLFRLDAYAMMEEQQLARFPFFRWIGVFGVDRGRPRSALESIEYASRLFDRPNRAVWVFPQGELLPNDIRPIECEPGFVRLARTLGAVQYVPVAFRYEFVREQRPECFVSIGECVGAEGGHDEQGLVNRLAARLTDLLDTLRADVAAGNTGGFRVLLAGRRSVSALLDARRDSGGRP